MTKDEALRIALDALIEVRDTNIHGLTLTQDYHDAITAIKAVLEAKDEPVAVWELFEDGWDSIAAPYWMELLPVGTKLYTAPPQRKPLTDEEIWACLPKDPDEMVFARAIEAKLKEKNK